MSDFNLKALISGRLRKVTGTVVKEGQADERRALDVVQHPPDLMGSGNKTVTAHGTPEPVATSTPIVKCMIKALDLNTGIIAIGDSNVDANSTPPVGYTLEAGEPFPLEIADLNNVYIDSSVDGEGVSFTYTARS